MKNKNKIYLISILLILLVLVCTLTSLIFVIKHVFCIRVLSLFYPIVIVDRVMQLDEPLNVLITFALIISLLVLLVSLISKLKCKYKLAIISVWMIIIDTMGIILYVILNNVSSLTLDIVFKILLNALILYGLIYGEKTDINMSVILNPIREIVFRDAYRRILYISFIYVTVLCFFVYGFIRFLTDKTLPLFLRISIPPIIALILTLISYLFIYEIKEFVNLKRVESKEYLKNYLKVAKMLLATTLFISLKFKNEVFFMSNFAYTYIGTFASNYYGITKTILIILSYLSIVIILLALALSDKNWRVMRLVTVMTCLDDLFYMTYKIVNHMSLFDYTVPCKVLYLFSMIEATIADKRLCSETTFDGREKRVKGNVKIYKYKLKKSGFISSIFLFISIIISFVAFLIEFKLFIILRDCKFSGIVRLVPIIILSLLLLYTYIFYKYIAYIFFWKISFYRKDRWIYRICYLENIDTDILTDVTVYKESKFVYFCRYTDCKNKKKVLIIPKCYPGIEEILYMKK